MGVDLDGQREGRTDCSRNKGTAGQGRRPSLAGSQLGPGSESWEEREELPAAYTPTLPCPALPQGAPFPAGLRDPALSSPPSCPGVAQPWGTRCAGEAEGPEGAGGGGREPRRGWASSSEPPWPSSPPPYLEGGLSSVPPVSSSARGGGNEGLPLAA